MSYPSPYGKSEDLALENEILRNALRKVRKSQEELAVLLEGITTTVRNHHSMADEGMCTCGSHYPCPLIKDLGKLYE